MTPFAQQGRSAAGDGVSPHAVIETDDVGPGATVGELSVIRAGVRIGAGVVIHPHVVIGPGVEIGEGSELFPGAVIGQEPAANDTTVRRGGDALSMRGPRVKDQASVGVGALLLPGVLVGRGAVVDAGSVVTRDVEPWTLVKGVPARFVRRVEEVVPRCR